MRGGGPERGATETAGSYHTGSQTKSTVIRNGPLIASVEGETPRYSRNGSAAGGFSILLTVQKYQENV